MQRSYVRHKRKNGDIFSWQCKLYIPVPLNVKNRFTEKARMYRMSQAELGAVAIMHYISQPRELTKAIREYKRAQRIERDRELKELKDE